MKNNVQVRPCRAWEKGFQVLVNGVLVAQVPNLKAAEAAAARWRR